MIQPVTLLVIVLMATATYLTRVSGYLFLRNRTLSPRLTRVLEAAPGCVLITVIAPDFVSGNVADLLALAITLLAATRLSILPTVIIAIGSAALLRQVIG
jgi:uncharacterized membrane protein